MIDRLLLVLRLVPLTTTWTICLTVSRCLKLNTFKMKEVATLHRVLYILCLRMQRLLYIPSLRMLLLRLPKRHRGACHKTPNANDVLMHHMPSTCTA